MCVGGERVSVGVYICMSISERMLTSSAKIQNKPNNREKKKKKSETKVKKPDKIPLFPLFLFFSMVDSV